MTDVLSLPLDVETLVHFGWSPGEMRAQADSSVSILAREAPQARVPTSALGRVHMSLASESFETLRWFVAPDRATSADIYDDIQITGSAEAFTDAEGAAKHSRHASPPRGTFRICTLVKNQRGYAVQRSFSDVFALIQAISTAFPELLIPAPASVSDVDAVVMDCLCQCVTHHIRTLSGFLPLLYFLFDTSENAFTVFASPLQAAVSAERSSRRPEKKSSWFNFGSKSHPSEGPFTVSEDIQFLMSSTSIFKSANTFKRVQQWHETAADLWKNTERLALALGNEGDALARVNEVYDSMPDILAPLPTSLRPAEDESTSDYPVAPNMPRTDSLLDMLRVPSKQVLVVSDAGVKLLTRLAEFSRSLPKLQNDNARKVQRLIETQDDFIPREILLAEEMRRHFLLRLTVMLSCVSHHLAESSM